MRPHFQAVLDDLNLLTELARFEPAVIGTPPLGIDIESSDIDVACTSRDLGEFESEVIARFGSFTGFVVQQIDDLPDPAVCVRFATHGWDIELFCQSLQIRDQWGVRHFHVEKRLLEIQPKLKSKVLSLKRSGQQTESAFSAALNLDGDPYEAMLRLESYSNRELALLVASVVERQ